MAVTMGIKPSEFWDMTHAEMNIIFKVYKAQMEEKAKEIKWLVWTTAALIRCEEMPDLDDWLEAKEKKEQTPDEMVTMARLLNAMYGGDEVVM